MAYFGPPAGAVDFLHELHFECPPFINPTDFISNKIHVRTSPLLTQRSPLVDTVKEDGDGQRLLPRKFLELRQLPPALAQGAYRNRDRKGVEGEIQHKGKNVT